MLSWLQRHAPSKANEPTVRTHVRGACWNVGDRSQFSSREPFLTRIDRGLFCRATSEEIVQWHTEANVQASLVTALAADGSQILSGANTATNEHGIDVIAARDEQTAGIEVKGCPSRDHADPKRAGEVKRSSPSNQAGDWYAQAVFAAMRLRGKEPTWRSVIVLPTSRATASCSAKRPLHSPLRRSKSGGSIRLALYSTRDHRLRGDMTPVWQPVGQDCLAIPSTTSGNPLLRA